MSSPRESATQAVLIWMIKLDLYDSADLAQECRKYAETSLSDGHLSRILNGKTKWGPETLYRVTTTLRRREKALKRAQKEASAA